MDSEEMKRIEGSCSQDLLDPPLLLVPPLCGVPRSEAPKPWWTGDPVGATTIGHAESPELELQGVAKHGDPSCTCMVVYWRPTLGTRCHLREALWTWMGHETRHLSSGSDQRRPTPDVIN